MDDKMMKQSRRSFLAASAAVLAASGVSVQPAGSQPIELTVSVLADAMRRVGLDPMAHSMVPDVKPLTAGTGTIIGPAVTTEWQSGTTRMTSSDVRENMFEPLDAAPAGSV